MMKKMANLAQASALAFAASLAILGSPASATTLKIATDSGAKGSEAGDAIDAWAAKIEEATGGEVKVSFPPKSVAPPPGIVDAVRNGVADGGFIFNGFIGQAAPPA